MIMKKFITLVFCFGLVGSAFAQSDRERAADVILNGGRNTGSYPATTQYPSTGSQQEDINAINREYDNKVASVQANGSLSQAEKDRIIRQLNNERARRISVINKRYGQRDNKREDDDRDEKNKVKKNGKDNGNHYGWEKGKGNPHKDSNWKNNGKAKGKKG
jgi:hypothetical protein